MALSDKEQADLLAKVNEIHRQVTTSADPKAKGGATLRWIANASRTWGSRLFARKG